MNAFVALVRKDLSLFLGDRRAVIMAFAAPILIGSFFGYVFGGPQSSKGTNKEKSRIKVLFIDQEKGNSGKELLSSLQKDTNLEVSTSDIDLAREAVRKGKVPVAIVIPAKFGEDAAQALFGAAAKPQITMLFDPSHQVEAGMIRGILTGIVMQTVTKGAFYGTSGKETAAAALRSLEGAKMDSAEKINRTGLPQSVENFNARPQAKGGGGAGGGLTIPFETKDEALTSRAGVEYNSYAHSFGGYGNSVHVVYGYRCWHRNIVVAAARTMAPLSRCAVVQDDAAREPRV